MYQKMDDQMSVYNYMTPTGKVLDENNRWVKMAKEVPCEFVEAEYARHFKEDGAPAKPSRMAYGALIIQAKLKTSDRETLQHIRENVYLQYFIGLNEFQTVPPFDASMMCHFRKRFPAEAMARIMEETLHPGTHTGNKDEDDPDEGKSPPANKGKLLMDATCTPANIKYLPGNQPVRRHLDGE